MKYFSHFLKNNNNTLGERITGNGIRLTKSRHTFYIQLKNHKNSLNALTKFLKNYNFVNIKYHKNQKGEKFTLRYQ